MAAWARSPAASAAAGIGPAVEAFLAGRPFATSPDVRLDLPPSFEQGNTVPFSVTVGGPTTATDHVRRVSVFADGNPFPEVATFHFTPGHGGASATTRIRLNEGDREVVAVAELSDGRVWLNRRAIEVAVSGCSGGAAVATDDPVPLPRPRLNVSPASSRDGVVEVRTMISHRMETGLRVDAAGDPIPRRIIHRMVCARDGEPIFAADLSPAVAANSYLGFQVAARDASLLTFTWYEDGGAVYRASHALAAI